MPTTALTPITGPSGYSPTGKGLTFVDADVANGNHFAASQFNVLLARNTGASTRNITITSQPLPGPYYRSQNAATTILAGAQRIFKLPYDGWADPTTGNISLSADHADVEFCVVDFTGESLTS